MGSPGARDRGVLTTEGQQAAGQLRARSWWRRTERAQLPAMEMHHPAAIALEGVGWIIVTRRWQLTHFYSGRAWSLLPPGDRPTPTGIHAGPCTHLLSPEPAACGKSKWD